MNFIIDYWYVIIAVACLGGCIGCALYRFIFEPRYDQIEQVKEWLKGAVVKAEKKLGSGTGELKLAYVYDLFVARFPWVARVITFDQFKEYVKGALEWADEYLEKNEKAKELINENK